MPVTAWRECSDPLGLQMNFQVWSQSFLGFKLSLTFFALLLKYLPQQLGNDKDFLCCFVMI